MFYIRLVLYFSRCALHTTANTFKWPFMACMQRCEAINANWIESEWVAISRQDPKPSCLIKVFLQHHLCMCFSSVQGKLKKCQSIQENVIKCRLHWPRLSSTIELSKTKMQQNRITKTICNLRKNSDHLLRQTLKNQKERKIRKRAKSRQSQSGAHSCCTFWPPLSQTCFARGRVIATHCTPCDYFLTPLFPLREEVNWKNRFFLGKSPKLWVGGGQES